MRRNRHRTTIRSRVTGPIAPGISGREDQFENPAGDAFDVLRAVFADELADYSLEVVHTAGTAGAHLDGTHTIRWHLEPRKIVLHRVEIERLAPRRARDSDLPEVVHWLIEAVAAAIGTDPDNIRDRMDAS